MRSNLLVANWKMNGFLANAETLGAEYMAIINDRGAASRLEVVFGLPATLLSRARGAGFPLAAQDCHSNASGACTGDISPEQLKDAGASYVILGHSERRQNHRESDQLIAQKTLGAVRAGLKPIICVGETAAERAEKQTLKVLGHQLAALPQKIDALTLAYEPVWAIGSGITPEMDEIEATHDFIRRTVAERFGIKYAEQTRILYGGSVGGRNAAAIFANPNVDGALVGGASLDSKQFLPIIQSIK